MIKNILEKFGILKNTHNFTDMDYLKRITEMRNEMHRDIVQEATSKTLLRHPDFDQQGILELKKPIGFYTEIRDPFDGESYLYFTVIGIDCITGDLVCENEDHDNIYLRYDHLPTDTLGLLHNHLVLNESYTIKPNLFV